MSKPDNPEFWLFGYGSLIWKPPPHYDRRIAGYINGYVRRFWQIYRKCCIAVAPSSTRLSFNVRAIYSNARSSHLQDDERDPSLTGLMPLTQNVKTSEDHRGTPEFPGRTVTIIERSFWDSLNDRYTIPEDKVWGVAYRIESAKVEEVRDYLDIREAGGYSIQYSDFHPADTPDSRFKCLVYVGMPDNPQFTGVQEPQSIAARILASRGPSGENKEYLYMLEKGLEQLSQDSGDAHVSDLVERAHALEAEGGAPFSKEHDRAIENELNRASREGPSVDVMEETERNP